MKIKLLSVRTHERRVRLRFPFRFGVVSLEQAPQIFIEARVRAEDGSEGLGMSAEMLVPKWFDKDPELSNEENFNYLRESLRMISGQYLSQSDFKPTFELSIENYRKQIESGALVGMNPLVASFGPALLDRAILDGLCRIEGVSFWEAIRGNLPGFCFHPVLADLEGWDWNTFLGHLHPLEEIYARHTVGLDDPITESDLKTGNRRNDGLPETLEEVISTYGNRYFKIKVCGDLDKDLARLEKISRILDRYPGCRITLDGNEQFKEMDQVFEFSEEIQKRSSLRRFWEGVAFLEQPLHRNKAFDNPIDRKRLGRAVIIDESDQEFSSFPEAREAGYSGVSSKSCKGFYKSLINLARCQAWNETAGAETFFMSGEDLTTQPGLATQQDLALVAILGINHVERNGHHYVYGFADTTQEEQENFLKGHPSLYTDLKGPIRLKIREGLLDLRSLGGIGFASNVFPYIGSKNSDMELSR